MASLELLSICKTGAEAERCRELGIVLDCFDWRVHFEIGEKAAQTTPSAQESPETLFSLFPTAGAVVANVRHVEIASILASFLYIPGEICRQGDVLEAARASGKTIFLERGAFLAPPDILRAVEKLEGSRVVIVDAGSAFGYSDRVLDPRALAMVRDAGVSLALHLSSLLEPQGERYRWRSQWAVDERFVEAYVRTGQAFGVNYFVCDESRHPCMARDLMATYS